MTTVATVILGMLCVHLLCFSVMFQLISTRLHGKRMGMEVFALGNLLLGCAYILQLLEGDAQWSAVNVLNHTLTLCAPVVYVLGALRFFGRAAALWRPLLALAIVYSAVQIATHHALGPAARHVLLAGCCALLFSAMAAAALYSARTFAQDMRLEMHFFALLVGGLGVLNGLKMGFIVQGGLAALDMRTTFQTIFYLYMSFLGTVLPPAIVWLVLRRLSDDLRFMAARDPLTGLLNRRGMVDAVAAHFRQPGRNTAHVLLLDIDHFKHINDRHGHQVGDQVLCHMAQILQTCTRQGDLICRLGGEEFVAICLNTDDHGALRLAERIRHQVQLSAFQAPGLTQPIHCTATLGVSAALHTAQALQTTLQDTDAALYRGKHNGRNRIETAAEPSASAAPAMHPASTAPTSPTSQLH